MLEVKDLHVNYGAVHALNGISLHVDDGEIVSLIGANGAGKTTLLKLLTGVNRPDAGTVELLSATPDDAAVRAKIGVVFEDAYFYESLTLSLIHI